MVVCGLAIAVVGLLLRHEALRQHAQPANTPSGAPQERASEVMRHGPVSSEPSHAPLHVHPTPTEDAPGLGLVEQDSEDSPDLGSLRVAVDVSTSPLWRGAPAVSGPVVISAAEFAFGPCTLGALALQPLTRADGAPELFEVDAATSCSVALGGGFSLFPSAELWAFPSGLGGQTTGVFGGELSWTGQDFTLGTIHVGMVGGASGAYSGEVFAQWAPTFDPFTLSVRTAFSWANADFQAFNAGAARGGGVNHADLAADLAWDLGAGVALSMGGVASIMLDQPVAAVLGQTFLYQARLGLAYTLPF
jgi:hypothetical protein